MKQKHAIVISAFPGCGKTRFFNLYNSFFNLKILDSDSSQFSWIYKDGIKTDQRNPEFPLNYICHIKSHIHDTDIIFVSSHDTVRKSLHDANIPFVLIYPGKELKEEWMNRFEERGNDNKFIKFQDEHWDQFIDELDQENCLLKIKFPLLDNIINMNLMHHIQNIYYKNLKKEEE